MLNKILSLIGMGIKRRAVNEAPYARLPKYTKSEMLNGFYYTIWFRDMSWIVMPSGRI